MHRLPYKSFRWAPAAFALALLAVVAACGDNGLSPDGVARIALHGPAGAALFVGDTARITATPLDMGGRAITGGAHAETQALAQAGAAARGATLVVTGLAFNQVAILTDRGLPATLV